MRLQGPAEASWKLPALAIEPLVATRQEINFAEARFFAGFQPVVLIAIPVRYSDMSFPSYLYMLWT